jgi:hypothetical protein
MFVEASVSSFAFMKLFILLLFALLPCAVQAQSASAELVPFRRGALWGYADRKGQLVLPLQFDEVGPYVEGLAWVRQGSRYGYIGGGGHLVTPVQYEQASNFRRGRATVVLGGDTFDIDRNGTRLTEPAPSAPEQDFLEQGDLLRQQGKVGFRFSVGRGALPPIYDEIRDLYHDGLVLVRQGQKWGVANAEGRLTLPVEYDAIRANADNGYAFPVVEQQGRLGYLSNSGTLLTPLKYTAAEPFVAGVARVTTAEGKVGYIDDTGREYFEQ